MGTCAVKSGWQGKALTCQPNWGEMQLARSGALQAHWGLGRLKSPNKAFSLPPLLALALLFLICSMTCTHSCSRLPCGLAAVWSMATWTPHPIDSSCEDSEAGQMLHRTGLYDGEEGLGSGCGLSSAEDEADVSHGDMKGGGTLEGNSLNLTSSVKLPMMHTCSSRGGLRKLFSPPTPKTPLPGVPCVSPPHILCVVVYNKMINRVTPESSIWIQFQVKDEIVMLSEYESLSPVAILCLWTGAKVQEPECSEASVLPWMWNWWPSWRICPKPEPLRKQLERKTVCCWWACGMERS